MTRSVAKSVARKRLDPVLLSFPLTLAIVIVAIRACGL